MGPAQKEFGWIYNQVISYQFIELKGKDNAIVNRNNLCVRRRTVFHYKFRLAKKRHCQAEKFKVKIVYVWTFIGTDKETTTHRVTHV